MLVFLGANGGRKALVSAPLHDGYHGGGGIVEGRVFLHNTFPPQISLSLRYFLVLLFYYEVLGVCAHRSLGQFNGAQAEQCERFPGTQAGVYSVK